MKKRKWLSVTVRIPVDVEDGDHGLCYITSPFIKGLMVAEPTENLADNKVRDAIEDLACASASHG